MANAIPKRCEVKPENTWNLCDIFPTDAAWFEELKDCEKYVGMIEAYKGKLSADPKALLNYLDMDEEISMRLNALGNYAERKSDEDTQNGYYQDMCTKFESLCIRLASSSSFDKIEIGSIDSEKLEDFYASVPALKKYERQLYLIERRKAHILSEKEEALLSKASQMARSGDNISAMLRDADLKFNDVTDKEGNKYPLSNGSYISYLMSEDRVLRKNAFESLYNGYSSFKNTLASSLDAQVKSLLFYSKARNFESSLDASLFATEVPTSVYYNLIETVNNNLEYMYKYIRLRKKLLGYDELHMYDLYTPIAKGVDKKVPYDEAKNTVLEALSILGDEYVSLLKEGFQNRWIDVYENVGKRSGAYSAGARPHPYVLLNYKDTLDDQFTLAHEMGHALHSYHSKQAQPEVYASYVIFVAEVASTCNEVLLMKYLLSKTADKKERLYLINHFLEQFRTTLYRQTMFAEFELLINKLAENNTALTADLLNEKYYELVKKYHGNDIVIDKDIEIEWARIPHFYMNFYVFQYATGFSAAVAIADRILSEGKTAVEDYIKFLSSGGSNDPISLLKIAGVDMSDPKPVEKALQLFNSLIDEAEALTE